jgi:hypothetical protein
LSNCYETHKDLLGGEVLQFPELCTKIVEYGEKLFLSHGIFVSWFFSTNGTSYTLPGVMDITKSITNTVMLKIFPLTDLPELMIKIEYTVMEQKPPQKY